MSTEVLSDSQNLFILSPFERLPRDLIWTILETTPESALHLRRVLPFQSAYSPITKYASA